MLTRTCRNNGVLTEPYVELEISPCNQLSFSRLGEISLPQADSSERRDVITETTDGRWFLLSANDAPEGADVS